MSSGLETALKEQGKIAEQKVLDEIVERQIRVVAGSFDRASAYTNVIILAGYAAFFGLWQLTKSLVSPKLSLLAALLISISAVSFVIFEIYKTFKSSQSILRLDKILLDPANKNDLRTLQRAFEEHDETERRGQLVLVPVWYITFSVSVLTGISGAAILMASFIIGLLD